MTILIIDDDLDDIELFLEAVSTLNEGHTVLSAVNGKEGLRVAKAMRPDIIFLDIHMPIMDGQETLLELRNDESLSGISICMLSTTSNPDEIQWYHNAGAKDFIIKPSSFDEICDALGTFILAHNSIRAER